jgi:hypothetical protein
LKRDPINVVQSIGTLDETWNFPIYKVLFIYIYFFTIIYVYTLRMAEDRRKSCTHCTAGASEIPGRGLGRGRDRWSGEDQNEVEP